MVSNHYLGRWSPRVRYCSFGALALKVWRAQSAARGLDMKRHKPLRKTVYALLLPCKSIENFTKTLRNPKPPINTPLHPVKSLIQLEV